MTRQQEIDFEIRNLAVRLAPSTPALFELPRLIYSQIMHDNTTRRYPIRVSYERMSAAVIK